MVEDPAFPPTRLVPNSLGLIILLDDEGDELGRYQAIVGAVDPNPVDPGVHRATFVVEPKHG